MRNFDFIRYEATPHERHIGIAEVRAYGRMMLRFKIIPKKSGDGNFPAPPSLRMGTEPHITYLSAFSIDSRDDEKDLMSVIREGVANHTTKVTPSQEPMF